MEQKTLNSVPDQLSQVEINPVDAEEEIDLAELAYLLWRHALQIICCMLVGALLAFGATFFFVTPLYKASASMYIVSTSSNSLVNLTDLQIGSQLTADYQQLLLSRPLLEKVIDSLDLKMSTGELAGEIAVANTSGTRIMTITVTDADPERAADIANELADQACSYLPQVMETETPNLVESAVIPTKRSSPSYSKNTMMGALLGVVLSCGVLIVKFLMNDTFNTPEDISKYFGIQPLGTIPDANLDGKHPNEQNRFQRLISRFQKG